MYEIRVWQIIRMYEITACEARVMPSQGAVMGGTEEVSLILSQAVNPIVVAMELAI